MMVEERHYSDEYRPVAKTPPGLDSRDMIEVILHEYDVLWDELLGRIRGHQGIFPLYFAILAGLVGLIYQTRSFQLFVFVPTVILVFLAYETNREFQIGYLAMYIGLLEQRVNELAGRKLLLWAHSTGLHRTVMSKYRIRSATQSRWNLNSVVVKMFKGALGLASLFSLFQGGLWLFENLQVGSERARSVVAISYGLTHVALLGFLLFGRIVQHQRVLSLVERDLKTTTQDEEGSAELRTRTAGSHPKAGAP